MRGFRTITLDDGGWCFCHLCSWACDDVLVKCSFFRVFLVGCTMASDLLLLFDDAPKVLWDELSGVSKTSWVAQEIFLDVSGADNVFASTPRDSSVELPPLSDTEFSVDFNVYSADVIQISSDDDVSGSSVDGAISCGGDSTEVDQTIAVTGIVWEQDIIMDDVDEMGIVWGEDIHVADMIL